MKAAIGYFGLFLLVSISGWEHQNGTHGLTVSTNVRNQFSDDNHYSHRVYLSYQGHTQDEFTLNKSYRSCQNIPKFEDDILTTSRKFYFAHEGETHTGDLRLYATMKPYGVHGGRIPISVDPETISLDDRTPVKVRYDCRQIPEEYTHAIVELEVSNGEAFQYIKEGHPAPAIFWTHFLQFLALAKTAMTVLLVGSKMGKLSLFERLDEYRFDYYRIPLKNIIIVIISGSLWLLIVYYLLPFKWFSWTTTITLTIGAFFLCLFLFMDFIDWIFNIEEANEFEGSGHFMDQPGLGESFNFKATVSLILTTLLVLAWFISRYWLLSNILAIGVACALVKIFRFNALYPAFLVLLGFLIFDVFWVFAGPILFNGHSVIHEVLSGLDFPLQLAVPGFSPFVPGATLSIIDIVVPTFYISFISRFGKEQHTNVYYLAHITAYAISLGIFTGAMVYTGSKQPALMYIIPSLFITTFLIAGCRKEWGTKLSIDSSLQDDGFRTQGNRKSKLADAQETNPRGMQRFDPKMLQGSATEEFKKFDDENAKENDAEA